MRGGHTCIHYIVFLTYIYIYLYLYITTSCCFYRWKAAAFWHALRLCEEKVRAGRDVPLSSGAEERVIRLCGDFSYATYATVSKNGRFHILPVLDSSNMPMLAERVTHGFKYPLFLSVPPNLWGQPAAWL